MAYALTLQTILMALVLGVQGAAAAGPGAIPLCAPSATFSGDRPAHPAGHSVECLLGCATAPSADLAPAVLGVSLRAPVVVTEPSLADPVAFTLRVSLAGTLGARGPPSLI